MRSKRSPNKAAPGGPQRRVYAFGGWSQLTLVCLAAAVIWLVVLPRIARIPHIAAQREANEARGINPSAMYYTELRAMPRIEADVRQRIRRQPHAVWSFQR